MSRICQSQKRTPAQTRTLQEHYFRRDADKLWEACWRTGCDRLRPGLSGGSQSQEIWHRMRLKSSVPSLRQALASFYDYDQMTIFLQARADQMELVESV